MFCCLTVEEERKIAAMKKQEKEKETRQKMAEMSYKEWMEKARQRRTNLPKNGYRKYYSIYS